MSIFILDGKGVINMKKRIGAIVLSFFLLAFMAGQTLAQGQQRAQDPTSHDADTYVQGESGDQARALDGSGTGTVGEGLGKSSQSLTRVVTRSSNPEVGEQVRAMAERHVQIQSKAKTSLSQMSKRSGVAKFLLGPDYRSASQLKGDIDSIKGDIDTLTELKDEVGSLDAADIESAITELQTEATTLESELGTQVSGFSLFGWVGRILAGY